MPPDGRDDAPANGSRGAGEAGHRDDRRNAGDHQQHQHRQPHAIAGKAHHGHSGRAGAEPGGAAGDCNIRAGHQDQIAGADPVQTGAHRAER